MKRAFGWGFFVCCIGGMVVSTAHAGDPVFEVRIAAINGNRLDAMSCTVDSDCPGDSTCVSSFCTSATSLSLPSGDAIAAGDMFTLEVFVRDWAVVDGGFCFGGSQACTALPVDTCPVSKFCADSATPCPSGDQNCGGAPGSCIDNFCAIGPKVAGYQFRVDESSFLSGDVGSFSFTQFACTSDNDCQQGFSDPTQCTCVDAGICDMGAGLCSSDASLFIVNRSDGIFFGAGPFFITSMGEPTISGVFIPPPGGGIPFTGQAKYLGTLVLDSSADAAGQFAIGLDPSGTKLSADTAVQIGTSIIQPALIEFGSDPCAGVTCPQDPECKFFVCQNVGGTGQCVLMNKPPSASCTDDGDLCTTDTCSGFLGTCGHLPVFCGIGEVCDPADGVCKMPPAGCVDIVSSNPPNCAIDARQPHSINNTVPPFGWDRIDLDFDMACDASMLTPSDFSVDVVPSVVTPPFIVGVTGVGNTATVMFDGPIPTRHYTCVTHTASGVQVCLGYLPGDVNGGGKSNASDITSLVDALNLVTIRPAYQTDLDRSTVTNPSDLTRLIDLLNGANVLPSFNGVSIGASCPSGP